MAILHLEVIVENKKGKEKSILVRTEHGKLIADMKDEILIRFPLAVEADELVLFKNDGEIIDDDNV